MVEDISQFYRVLDLKSGASMEDVRRSYRELVKVWHPDRFERDSSVQQKAQEKLKEINFAYERLQEYLTGRETPSQEHFDSTHSNGGHGKNKTADAKQNSKEEGQVPPKRSSTTKAPEPDNPSDLWGLAILAVLFLIILFIWANGGDSGYSTPENR